MGRWDREGSREQEPLGAGVQDHTSWEMGQGVVVWWWWGGGGVVSPKEDTHAGAFMGRAYEGKRWKQLSRKHIETVEAGVSASTGEYQGVMQDETQCAVMYLTPHLSHFPSPSPLSHLCWPGHPSHSAAAHPHLSNPHSHSHSPVLLPVPSLLPHLMRRTPGRRLLLPPLLLHLLLLLLPLPPLLLLLPPAPLLPPLLLLLLPLPLALLLQVFPVCLQHCCHCCH